MRTFYVQKYKRRLKYAFMPESKFLVGIKTKRNCRERERERGKKINFIFLFYNNKRE